MDEQREKREILGNEHQDATQKNNSPVFIDVVLSVFAIFVWAIVMFLFGRVSRWLGWYILAIVLECILLIVEFVRSRIPLPEEYQKYQRDRIFSLIGISFGLFACFLVLLKDIYHLP